MVNYPGNDEEFLCWDIAVRFLHASHAVGLRGNAFCGTVPDLKEASLSTVALIFVRDWWLTALCRSQGRSRLARHQP